MSCLVRNIKELIYGPVDPNQECFGESTPNVALQVSQVLEPCFVCGSPLVCLCVLHCILGQTGQTRRYLIVTLHSASDARQVIFSSWDLIFLPYFASQAVEIGRNAL